MLLKLEFTSNIDVSQNLITPPEIHNTKVADTDYIEGLAIIGGFAAIFVPILIWILSQIVEMRGSIGELSENVGRIDERLKGLEKGIDRWQSELRDEFLRIYDLLAPKKATSNPITQEEKERLLRRYQLGTISREEAISLQSILEEEKKEAEGAGNVEAAIAIGMLLAGLAYFLNKLIQEE